jgi:hypothetical protein
MVKSFEGIVTLADPRRLERNLRFVLPKWIVIVCSLDNLIGGTILELDRIHLGDMKTLSHGDQATK